MTITSHKWGLDLLTKGTSDQCRGADTTDSVGGPFPPPSPFSIRGEHDRRKHNILQAPNFGLFSRAILHRKARRFRIYMGIQR